MYHYFHKKTFHSKIYSAGKFRAILYVNGRYRVNCRPGKINRSILKILWIIDLWYQLCSEKTVQYAFCIIKWEEFPASISLITSTLIMHSHPKFRDLIFIWCDSCIIILIVAYVLYSNCSSPLSWFQQVVLEDHK